MTTWTPPHRADHGAPFIPAPGPKALAALPSTGRMPILQGLILFFGIVAAQIASGGIGRLAYGALGESGAEILYATLVVGLSLAVYLLAVRVIGARPATDFEGVNWWRELLAGLLLGALLMSVVVSLAYLNGSYRVEGLNPDPLILLVAADSILAGVSEEIMFRAGLLRLIEHRLGTWWALGLTSALFGAAHLANPEADQWGAIAIMLEAGVLLGACYIVTRRLWLVIGVHAAWNFTQGGVFSSDVSGTGSENIGLLSADIDGPRWLTGGVMGFEGSLTAVAVCAGVGLLLLLVARRRGLIIPRGAFRSELIGPCGPVDLEPKSPDAPSGACPR